MKRGIDASSCGPLAAIKALKCYGVRCNPQKMAELCGTTKKGTDDWQLQEGIVSFPAIFGILGFNTSEWEIQNGNLAFGRLLQALEKRPVLLCMDYSEHWVAAIGKLGKKVIIFDPDDNPLNRNKDRTRIMARAALLKRWIGKNGLFYGMAVVKPNSRH